MPPTPRNGGFFVMVVYYAFFSLPSFLFWSFPSCFDYSIFEFKSDCRNQMRAVAGRGAALHTENGK